MNLNLSFRNVKMSITRFVVLQLNLRSPHRNSTFQKHFGLPPEEFLISDFSCSLKRKMPLQVATVCLLGEIILDSFAFLIIYNQVPGSFVRNTT